VVLQSETPVFGQRGSWLLQKLNNDLKLCPVFIDHYSAQAPEIRPRFFSAGKRFRKNQTSKRKDCIDFRKPNRFGGLSTSVAAFYLQKTKHGAMDAWK